MTRPGYVRVANDLGASEQAVELAEDHYLAALGLFVLCLGYCDRQLTDGHITTRAMSRAVAHGAHCADAIAELERVGFLEVDADGWRIAHYLDWQRSRAEIEAASESARNAAHTRWSNAKGNAGRNAGRNAKEIEEIDRKTLAACAPDLPASGSDGTPGPAKPKCPACFGTGICDDGDGIGPYACSCTIQKPVSAR
ncbi:MAG: hypothetical protein Q7W16_06260 [Coriobacteriia bacterium]|nr:hypothetical protein [Coriobacteriia bacterium]